MMQRSSSSSSRSEFEEVHSIIRGSEQAVEFERARAENEMGKVKALEENFKDSEREKNDTDSQNLEMQKEIFRLEQTVEGQKKLIQKHEIEIASKKVCLDSNRSDFGLLMN